MNTLLRQIDFITQLSRKMLQYLINVINKLLLIIKRSIIIFYINYYSLSLLIFNFGIIQIFNYLFSHPNIITISDINYCIDNINTWFQTIIDTFTSSEETTLQPYVPPIGPLESQKFKYYVNVKTIDKSYIPINLIYLKATLSYIEYLMSIYHLSDRSIFDFAWNFNRRGILDQDFDDTLRTFSTTFHDNLFKLDEPFRINIIKNLALISRNFNDLTLKLLISNELQFFANNYPADVRQLINEDLYYQPIFNAFYNKKPIDATSLDLTPPPSPTPLVINPQDGNRMYNASNDWTTIDTGQYPQICNTLIEDICRHVRLMNVALSDSPNSSLSETQIKIIIYNFLLEDHVTDYQLWQQIKLSSPNALYNFMVAMIRASYYYPKNNSIDDATTLLINNIFNHLVDFDFVSFENQYGIGVELNIQLFKDLLQRSKALNT